MFIYEPGTRNFHHELKAKLDIPRTQKFRRFVRKLAENVALVTAWRVAEGIARARPNATIQIYIRKGWGIPLPDFSSVHGPFAAEVVSPEPSTGISKYYRPGAGAGAGSSPINTTARTVPPARLTGAVAGFTRVSTPIVTPPPTAPLSLPSPFTSGAHKPARIHFGSGIPSLFRRQTISRAAVRSLFRRARRKYLKGVGEDLVWTLRDRYRFPTKPVAPIRIASAEDIHDATAEDLGGVEPKIGDPAPGALKVRAKQLPKRTQTYVEMELLSLPHIRVPGHDALTGRFSALDTDALEVLVIDTPGLTPDHALPEDLPGERGVIAYIPMGGLKRMDGRPWLMYKPEGEVFRDSIYQKFGGQWIVRRGEKAGFLYDAYGKSAIDFSKLPSGRYQDLY